MVSYLESTEPILQMYSLLFIITTFNLVLERVNELNLYSLSFATSQIKVLDIVYKIRPGLYHIFSAYFKEMICILSPAKCCIYRKFTVNQ